MTGEGMGMGGEYRVAAGHLQAALTAMTRQRDTLAVAVIAQALDVVERGVDAADGGLATGAVANRRPC